MHVLTGAAGDDAISGEIHQAGLSNAQLIRLMSVLSLDGETKPRQRNAPSPPTRLDSLRRGQSNIMIQENREEDHHHITGRGQVSEVFVIKSFQYKSSD